MAISMTFQDVYTTCLYNTGCFRLKEEEEEEIYLTQIRNNHGNSTQIVGWTDRIAINSNVLCTFAYRHTTKYCHKINGDSCSLSTKH